MEVSKPNQLTPCRTTSLPEESMIFAPWVFSGSWGSAAEAGVAITRAERNPATRIVARRNGVELQGVDMKEHLELPQLRRCLLPPAYSDTARGS